MDAGADVMFLEPSLQENVLQVAAREGLIRIVTYLASLPAIDLGTTWEGGDRLSAPLPCCRVLLSLSLTLSLSLSLCVCVCASEVVWMWARYACASICV